MKRLISLISLFLYFFLPLNAQLIDEQPYSVNEGTLIGIGGYNIKNTYLSPSKYAGWGVRVLNERMKIEALANYRISSQQMFHVDLSSIDNPASTIGASSGFVSYSHGYHYRFRPVQGLKILTGASLQGMLGFVYNTQNGNNPIAVNADLDLNFSSAAIYSFRFKDYPLTCRFQTDIPFSGVLFAPNYGQSYYEIFGLGNTSGIVNFSSFHNKFAMRNYLTIDFPVWIFTVRAGYLNSLYYTDINNIQTHHVSHNFMIGLVKEFVSFSGKRLKNTHLYHSAYY